jgi:hypothetical protein
VVGGGLGISDEVTFGKAGGLACCRGDPRNSVSTQRSPSLAAMAGMGQEPPCAVKG